MEVSTLTFGKSNAPWGRMLYNTLFERPYILMTLSLKVGMGVAGLLHSNPPSKKCWKVPILVLLYHNRSNGVFMWPYFYHLKLYAFYFCLRNYLCPDLLRREWGSKSIGQNDIHRSIFSIIVLPHYDFKFRSFPLSNQIKLLMSHDPFGLT